MIKILKKQLNNIVYSVLGCSTKGIGKDINQDSFLINSTDEMIVCLLADGLGSAINSEIGSEAICSVANEIIQSCGVTSNFPQNLKRHWLASLRLKPISCDTTFKFLIILKEEIIFGGIGDGWMVGIVDGIYFDYKIDNSFSNQTDSMLSIGYDDKFRIVRMPYKTIQVLSLATDGFSEDIEDNRIKDFLMDCLGEMDNDVNAFAKELEKMMENWPIRTNQDDKTVIFVGGRNE